MEFLKLFLDPRIVAAMAGQTLPFAVVVYFGAYFLTQGRKDSDYPHRESLWHGLILWFFTAVLWGVSNLMWSEDESLRHFGTIIVGVIIGREFLWWRHKINKKKVLDRSHQDSEDSGSPGAYHYRPTDREVPVTSGFDTAGLSKKAKGWLIFSIAWFAVGVVFTLVNINEYKALVTHYYFDDFVEDFFISMATLNAPFFIGWAIWCGKNLSPSGKAIKVLVIVAVIWFLLTLWYVDLIEGLSELSDVIENIPLLLILNSPLIIGWGTRWISREEIK